MRLPSRTLSTYGIVLLAAAIILLIILLTRSCTVEARELYPGQYDHIPKQIRDWFSDQKVPAGPEKGKSCCSTADGTEAEEDIRGDEYWTRFTTYSGRTDWMPVPREAVIKDPNLRGVPVVWYYLSEQKPVIRCYAPGAGL